MPGLGRSPYQKAGFSSSDRAGYPGAGMRLRRLSFPDGNTVMELRCLLIGLRCMSLNVRFASIPIAGFGLG